MGALQYHFDSKTDLLVAVVEVGWNDLVERSMSVTRRAPPVALVSSMWASYHQPECRAAFMVSSDPNIRADVAVCIAPVFDAARSRLDQLWLDAFADLELPIERVASALLRIETDFGVIEVAVHVDRAPTTAAYVRRLVDDGVFADASFYRSTTLRKPDRRPLIQGGPLAPLFEGSDTATPEVAVLKTIETTDDTGLRHQAGTVSLARDLIATGHVLPELFICLDDYPDLDAGGRSEPDERGFPAFGTLTGDTEAVAAIAALDTNGATSFEFLAGEILTEPVRISNTTYTTSYTESAD